MGKFWCNIKGHRSMHSCGKDELKKYVNRLKEQITCKLNLEEISNNKFSHQEKNIHNL